MLKWKMNMKHRFGHTSLHIHISVYFGMAYKYFGKLISDVFVCYEVKIPLCPKYSFETPFLGLCE